MSKKIQPVFLSILHIFAYYVHSIRFCTLEFLHENSPSTQYQLKHCYHHDNMVHISAYILLRRSTTSNVIDHRYTNPFLPRNFFTICHLILFYRNEDVSLVTFRRIPRSCPWRVSIFSVTCSSCFASGKVPLLSRFFISFSIIDEEYILAFKWSFVLDANTL